MNPFDTAIQAFLTHTAMTCGVLNHPIRVIADLYTFKGLVLVPVLWWIWFKPSQRGEWEREMVVATIASGLLALAVFRVIARYLPFRMRPMFNPDLHFNFPSGGLDPAVLPAWSSFPSDRHITAARLSRLALSDRHTRGGGDWGDHHLEHDSGPH
jgi:hypothetical protein